MLYISLLNCLILNLLHAINIAYYLCMVCACFVETTKSRSKPLKIRKFYLFSNLSYLTIYNITPNQVLVFFVFLVVKTRVRCFCGYYWWVYCGIVYISLTFKSRFLSSNFCSNICCIFCCYCICFTI